MSLDDFYARHSSKQLQVTLTDKEKWGIAHTPSEHDEFIPTQDILEIVKRAQEWSEEAQEYFLLMVLRFFLMPRWHTDFGRRLKQQGAGGLLQVWHGHKLQRNPRVYTDKAFTKSNAILEEWLNDIVDDAKRRSA